MKVTHADSNRNARFLLRDGSGAQENRIVTTVANRETGERVRDDLNEALHKDGLQNEQAGEYAEAGIEWTTQAGPVVSSGAVSV